MVRLEYLQEIHIAIVSAIGQFFPLNLERIRYDFVFGVQFDVLFRRILRVKAFARLILKRPDDVPGVFRDKAHTAPVQPGLLSLALLCEDPGRCHESLPVISIQFQYPRVSLNCSVQHFSFFISTCDEQIPRDFDVIRIADGNYRLQIPYLHKGSGFYTRSIADSKADGSAHGLLEKTDKLRNLEHYALIYALAFSARSQRKFLNSRLCIFHHDFY